MPSLSMYILAPESQSYPIYVNRGEKAGRAQIVLTVLQHDASLADDEKRHRE